MDYPHYADVYFSMSSHPGVQQQHASAQPSPSPPLEPPQQHAQHSELPPEQHPLQDDERRLVAEPPWAIHSPNPMTATPFHPEDLNHVERGIAGFVSKLYQSLQAPDNGQKYARWCRHDGKDMFIIDCIPKFTEVVLPRLFKHCKFASFVRQLNIYGFQRDTDARKSKDTKDKESCRWYHPQFQPGRRDLFHLIRRKAAHYSRRKRAKSEKDPETILNVDSGDESDSDEKERRRSSSVSSAAISIMHSDYPSQQQSQQLLPRIQAPPQPLPFYYPPAQDPHPLHALTQLTPVVCVSSSSSPSTLSNIKQEPPEAEVDGMEALLHLQPPATEIGNRPTDLAMSSQAILHEQELRVQLVQMRRSYQKMHRFFTDQINKAYGQIEEQKKKIEELESSTAAVAASCSAVRPTLEMTSVTATHGHSEAIAVGERTAPSSCMPYTPTPTDYLNFLPPRIAFPPGSKAEPLATKMDLPRSADHLGYGFMFPPDGGHRPFWGRADLPHSSTQLASAVAVAAATAATTLTESSAPAISDQASTPQQDPYGGLTTSKYDVRSF